MPLYWDILLSKFLVLEALGLVGAEAALAVFLVFGVTALEEIDAGIPLECQYMRGYTVQEPTVVRDYHYTSGEILKSFLQSPYGVHIHIVGRLVQQKHIALVLECESQVQPVPFTSGKYAAEFFLICSCKVEA